jgi:hypothetical protein
MSAGDPPVSRRGRRALSAEERALWRGVARSVKPLRRERDAVDEEADAVLAVLPPKAKPKPVKPAAAPARPTKPPGPPPLAPLARREKQKLVRGRAAIDARLDLHGMTQAQAHTELAHFLRRAQAKARGQAGRGAACCAGKCRCGSAWRNSATPCWASRRPIRRMAGRARFMCGCGGRLKR